MLIFLRKDSRWHNFISVSIISTRQTFFPRACAFRLSIRPNRKLASSNMPQPYISLGFRRFRELSTLCISSRFLIKERSSQSTCAPDYKPVSFLKMFKATGLAAPSQMTQYIFKAMYQFAFTHSPSLLYAQLQQPKLNCSTVTKQAHVKFTNT